MSESLVLRVATESDDARIREWVCAGDDYSAFPLPLQKQLAETQWLGWCAGLRGQDGATTWVLCEGAETVGVLVLQGADVVRILDVIVAPEERGRGIGTWLFETLQRKYNALELQVVKDNPARRLYEHQGFAVVGQDDLHVHMRWLCSP
ncbi:MAG: GNAT superfamily N-acetyltransferase [Polyangiales bacterium]|jgi:GNAT superfamily N-acetyltransferase